MKKIIYVLTMLFVCTPIYAEIYTVERVIDGDTIVVTTPEGKTEEIQLIGINAPNVVFPEGVDRTLMDPTTESVNEADDWGVDLDTLDKMGQEAAEFVKGLIKPGQEVRLEFDVQEWDKYGRLLAYFYLDYPYAVEIKARLGFYYIYDENGYVTSNFLNATIISSGYATPMTIPPNVKYADLFKELYEEARKEGRGLWKNRNTKGKIHVRVRVTNQSFAVSPVDIKILIDGKIIVNEDFSVGDQHLYKSFEVSLSEGKHDLSVSSKKGQANLDKQFVVTNKQRWIDIGYVYYPKTHYNPTPRQFDFQIVGENRLVE